jgi:hypothetical protein
LQIAGWQPVGVARDAIQALINTLQFLATAAIWIVLFLIPVLSVMFFPLYLIGRALLRWRNNRRGRVITQTP